MKKNDQSLLRASNVLSKSLDLSHRQYNSIAILFKGREQEGAVGDSMIPPKF